MNVFIPLFLFTAGLLLSSCGDKPGNQRVEKPETNTTPDNLQTETSPASNAPEMLPPPPEPLSLVSRDGLFYKGSDTTPFTGKYEETFDSGSPRMEINLVNGIKEGLEKSWSEEGKLLLEGNFKGGQRHGVTKSWHENGQILSESSYLNGLLHGPSRTWFANGQKDTEAVYTFGKIEGKSLSWFDSGAKATEAHYRDNILHGLETRWDNEGKILSQTRYDNGTVAEVIVESEVPLEYPAAEEVAEEDPVLEPPAPQEVRFTALDAVQVVVRDSDSDKVLLSKTFAKDEKIVLPISGNFKVLASKGENLLLSKDGADTQLGGSGLINNREVVLTEAGALQIQGGE